MLQNKPGSRLVLFAVSATLGIPSVHAAETITPSTFTLAAGQSLPLTIAGAPASGVTWTLSPAMGTVSGGVSSAVYTAPVPVTKNQNVQVIATTVSTPVTIIKATITLVPAITVTVTPTSADVMSNNQQTFSATVTGSPITAVTWSTSLGSISSAGLYTAPTVAGDTPATVTATAQADQVTQGSVAIRLHSQSGLWFTTQANGLQNLFFNGLNYNYLYGEALVTSVTTVTSNGSVSGGPTCTGTFTSTTVSKHCTTTGGDALDVSVTFSAPAAAAGTTTAPGTNYGTIQADIQITNDSATDTISQAMLSILGMSMAQYNAAASKVAGINPTNPITYANFVTGQWVMWSNAVSPAITMNQACGWSYVCKNQPLISNIGPGQTATASFSLRITNDTTATMVNLAPEAYAAYQAVYPSLVNWPDRRPIMNWFIADTGHQSATNPRGYLWQPTLNVSNIANFQSQVMAQAQTILTQIQARPIQPQGIVIWDLEGEEFIQPTTYVGDPRVFSEGYSPEMDATADSLFALFQNAGLKVGITLRPQYLQWGAVLPTSCNYSTDINYKEYFINVGAPFQQKFFACDDPAGLVWTLIPNGNGGQTFYTAAQTAQVTALLMSKVAYAHARWGTTLYYVDTAVSEGGAPIDAGIFRALQAAYPDCLFMPEQSYVGTMGATMPYTDPSVASDPKLSPLSWRYFYPTGADAVYFSNCTGTCWTNNVANFETGQQVGDIPIYTVPSQISATQLTAIESMIQTARSQASTITVTDSSSGSQYSFLGSPGLVYQYPLKIRVYFADTAADLAASTTYCEAGGWTGTNTCTLNLSGLVVAQIEYYDFNNQLVMTGAVQPL